MTMMEGHRATPIVVSVIVTALVLVIVTRRSNQRLSSRFAHPARLALSVAVIAVLGACLTLFGRYVGLRSPLFALNAAAVSLGLVALTRPLFSWSLPRALRSTRAWERAGKLHRIMGVSQFGAAVRRPPLRYLNSMVYLGASPQELPRLRRSILDAEGAHFWGTLLTIPFVAYALFLGWWDSVLWVVAFHIVLNAYPMLHLRQVRGRVERLMAAPSV